MEMDLTKDDLMALDVEKERADREKTVVSVVPNPESHAITLNGFGGSPRHSAPSTANHSNHYMDDASAARLHRANVNQASRQPQPSPIHTKAAPDQLHLQSSLQSLRKSSTSSDEDSSDDLAMEKMPRPLQPPAATMPTGLCYDVRMRYHCELDPPKQRLDFHPEDPRRIYAIYKELCLAGLLDDPMSTRPIVSRPLLRINARNATQAEICLVHDTKHFQFVERTKDMTEESLVHLERQYDSIYFNRLTYASALLSAGGAIDTCRAVAGRQLKNAIAVIRPPGHHAECNRPMGFCIFDNVSISAKVCQMDFPETCRKILILDWDVHHGNGIQQSFYQDPNVLYISIHVHEDGNFYPSGPYGDHLHCGAGPGLGKNINIPWPTKGMGDADYLFAFQNVVLPVAYNFNPDFVIIAAGFDAAAGDQLGGCFVSPAGYAHMTSMLMPLAHGKIVACLEGGYNLRSISKSALAVTRTLMGEPPDRLAETSPTASGIATVQKVAAYQSRFWPCLYPKDMDQGFKALKRKTVGQADSANYDQAIPLIVLFHDPPEVMGTPDPATKRFELQNTWLADGLKHYVDWAARQGFGVIDVNIPKHLTDEETELQDDRTSHMSEPEELAVYLWENYIDNHDATKIFLIGVGTAHQGIMHLVNNREGIFQRVHGIVNFIADEPLVPVSDQNLYYLSKWYKANSCNFVSQSHLVWVLPPGQKKPSKRFGTLVASPAKGLNDMLVKHQGEVQAFILGKLGGSSMAEAARRGSAAS
ncbi:Histone deacetylase hda1 [Sticta canariensis]|nr:Histone deacetylase hda1 [Sticta canariensis]